MTAPVVTTSSSPNLGGSVPDDAILAGIGLEKAYGSGRKRRGERDLVRALGGVSIGVRRGEWLSVVGESGSGKTTLARVLLSLTEPDRGQVLFDGEDLTAMRGRRLREMRQRVQVVFQNPWSSLDPRMRVGTSVAEPLRAAGVSRAQRHHQVAEVFEQLGLEPSMAARYPHEFSGGQRQRVAIARAVVSRPDVVILDEPTSALDVSVQAQVMNLLVELRKSYGLTYVMIAHDLGLVGRVSDTIAVMYAGQLMEYGSTAEVYDNPSHPYTAALISAAPIPDPDRERGRARIPLPDQGRRTASASTLPGCPLQSRCWRAREVATRLAGDAVVDLDGASVPRVCAEGPPPPLALVGSGRSSACHFTGATG